MVVSKAEVGEVAVLDVFLLTMQLIGGGRGRRDDHYDPLG
jgi:hypothetical protein